MDKISNWLIKEIICRLILHSWYNDCSVKDSPSVWQAVPGLKDSSVPQTRVSWPKGHNFHVPLQPMSIPVKSKSTTLQFYLSNKCIHNYVRVEYRIWIQASPWFHSVTYHKMGFDFLKRAFHRQLIYISSGIAPVSDVILDTPVNTEQQEACRF